MKAGVVGGGNWGKNIARTLHALGRLDSIVDIHEGARAHFAEQYPDIRLFTSVEELLETPVSAVCLATPAQSHFSLAKQVLGAGKDVFVEKPLALSSAEG